MKFIVTNNFSFEKKKYENDLLIANPAEIDILLQVCAK
jgi:hypothetical protein